MMLRDHRIPPGCLCNLMWILLPNLRPETLRWSLPTFTKPASRAATGSYCSSGSTLESPTRKPWKFKLATKRLRPWRLTLSTTPKWVQVSWELAPRLVTQSLSEPQSSKRGHPSQLGNKSGLSIQDLLFASTNGYLMDPTSLWRWRSTPTFMLTLIVCQSLPTWCHELRIIHQTN